jgi:hypothetical protein
MNFDSGLVLALVGSGRVGSGPVRKYGWWAKLGRAGGKAAPGQLGWQLGFGPKTKTEIENLFLFIKPFISSNSFDSNSNLNVLLYAK